MKCENCGGNLSLEELVCPHCGTINKHAQQHVHDMNRFKGDYEDTKSNVYKVTRNYAGITVRAAIIAGLVILTVVFGVIASESYSIHRAIKEGRAERNVKATCAILDGYLEEEDYLGFSTYVYVNCIDTYDSSFEKYAPIERAASQYSYAYQYLMQLHESLQKNDEYDTPERYLEMLCDQLNYFYDGLDLEEYSYYKGAVCEENRQILERMEETLQILLRTYCGLTEEEAASLKSLSTAKRMVLLEERCGYAE